MEFQTISAARMPTREMFVSFFREAYDREPFWAKPVAVGVPCLPNRRFEKISVDEYGGFDGWPAYLWHKETLYLGAREELSDSLYGTFNLTCDGYWLKLRIRYMGTFETRTVSAHRQIYITSDGTLLMPAEPVNLTFGDFYLEFLFESDTCERLKRLYFDGLLVDYSVFDFSNDGSVNITRQKESIEDEPTKKEKGGAEKGGAASNYNAFSTREIADGSAIATLIKLLTSSEET